MAKKPTVRKTFLATLVINRFNLYINIGADPRIKGQVRCMTFNGSGIRDIHRVLGGSIAGILIILRLWFKTSEEPLVEGHFKRV
jgi:hypothetical protein